MNLENFKKKFKSIFLYYSGKLYNFYLYLLNNNKKKYAKINLLFSKFIKQNLLIKTDCK